jgi:CRISPR/Cas system-associated exonuclease Cas4 (RecB family)
MARVRAIHSPSASSRRAIALDWLRAQANDREVTVVGATWDGAIDVTRDVVAERGSSFGWRRTTLLRLAGELAAPLLASAGKVTVAPLAVEAVCARIVHRMAAQDALGRFAPLAQMPGLPRALARTFEELRMSAIEPAGLARDEELARLYAAYVAELAGQALADRAEVFAHAVIAAAAAEPRPCLFLDVALRSAREAALAAALFARAEALVTVPTGDERTLSALAQVGVTVEAEPAAGPLKRLQSALFAEQVDETRGSGRLVVTSAPGESRECVEIARAILAATEASPPIRLDRIAIVLRAPTAYRAHVEEALRRARVPAFFARGSTRPDPSGRAMLALLGCAAEKLSATRFAEYLSLGEVPEREAGAPPAAPPTSERRPPPDDELAGVVVTEDEPEEMRPAPDPLRAPQHWERLLVDAAVIGGIDRWTRRLSGHARKLELDREHARQKGQDGLEARAQRDLESLASLRTFALPLLEELSSLPSEAPWGDWIERLSALAARALRNPERVQRVLAELAPMATVGPVSLPEIRIVLERRLLELSVPPASSRYGRVFVGAPEDLRGLAFDAVFVPGLAEKTFPQKVTEDPILPDAARAEIAPSLATNATRSAEERLALRLAAGAADRELTASYPRVDLQQSRPRTPSFYALELLRAAEGALPGFDDLARRAQQSTETRIGWPAPRDANDAIDEAEYDLAILERLEGRPEEETSGAARYLLAANPHLSRALRFRAERWAKKKWWPSDGLVDPRPAAKAALAAHALRARSYSPTALQNFAACPYRFVLQAILRLAPREERESLEELDALQKGSIFHQTMYELFVALRAKGLLPLDEAHLDEARSILDEVMASVAESYAEELAPAIERVWDDAIAQIKADAAEALRRLLADEEWTPTSFELSFGLADRREQQDPASKDDPVELDCGIKLRGSIDLVETSRRNGWIRATDFKTGKIRVTNETVIQGGKVLQPVLYALVLEKLVTGKTIDGGNLYYATSTGRYERFPVPLDAHARDSAKMVADTIGDALDQGFLPAAPAKDECTWCDYRPVCGPYEEQRTKPKPKARLEKLVQLRKRP